MPVINSIAAFAGEMAAWRQHLHQHPELGFDCHETAGFVSAKLQSFGITEIHGGIATSGIVAIIEGQGAGPTIGLRADMDALPMPDLTDAPYASRTAGAAHACGHDGHTAMLLGAARYLAETRNFCGRVALVFQPAEEDGGGGEVMVHEGILDRFEIDQVYALHNAPNTPLGHFETAPGPVMAAVDEFKVTFKGVGGHAAWPELTRDPVPASVAFVQALDTVVSRNRSGLDALILSVTQIHAGTAFNVIAEDAFVGGTVRAFEPEMRDMAETRIKDIANGIAVTYGVTAHLDYERGYPPTINHDAETKFALEVAAEIVGPEATRADRKPDMGSEDFSYMLEKRRGAYVMLGQGDTPMCHNPAYDFNDEIAPIGASFFARLVERAQPIKP